MVLATGFSQNTGTPASTAATTSSGWASVAAAMTTPSIPAASSFAGSSAVSTPRRSPTARVAAGTASVTTSDVTDGRVDSVSAWNAPIRPSPISPILMGTPIRSAGPDALAPGRVGADRARVRPVQPAPRVDDRRGDGRRAGPEPRHRGMGDGHGAPAQLARQLPAAHLDVPAGRQVREGLGEEHQP